MSSVGSVARPQFRVRLQTNTRVFPNNAALAAGNEENSYEEWSSRIVGVYDDLREAYLAHLPDQRLLAPWHVKMFPAVQNELENNTVVTAYYSEPQTRQENCEKVTETYSIEKVFVPASPQEPQPQPQS